MSGVTKEKLLEEKAANVAATGIIRSRLAAAQQAVEEQRTALNASLGVGQFIDHLLAGIEEQESPPSDGSGDGTGTAGE